MNLRKNIFIALLVSMGVAIGYIESLIPLPIPVPGARLGLSNIIILTTLVLFGYKEGIMVACLKSFLLMLVLGHVTSFFYSITGGILSCLGMIFAIKYLVPKISNIGVSEIGSACHNIGQVLVAGLIIQNWKIITYLPFLLLLGIFTGFFVGLSTNYIVEVLEKHMIFLKR
ncbi:MAG: Gx transporter family protein [Tissierellia bacterium]|nr:Gx transporter family protein [Tissierellia bacterium]